ncbi:hypothetical protein TURU_106423 [Turdus rufiventris]|nr:hypothetical protein TURU_106423 [Turdus rufiventris]
MISWAALKSNEEERKRREREEERKRAREEEYCQKERKEMILPLYTVLVRHNWNFLSNSGLLRTAEIGSSWSRLMTKGLEHLSYEERLKHLGLFCLEKRR